MSSRVVKKSLEMKKEPDFACNVCESSGKNKRQKHHLLLRFNDGGELALGALLRT